MGGEAGAGEGRGGGGGGGEEGRGMRGEGGYTKLQTYVILHKIVINILMKRFHTKFNLNRIIDADFRILRGGMNFEVETFFHQLLARISIFCLKMLVGNI